MNNPEPSSRPNIAALRSAATLIDNKEEKIAACREVLRLALEWGDGMAAQEVAPFAGQRISRQEYAACMHRAIQLRDKKNVVWCSRRCGRRPSKFELSGLIGREIDLSPQLLFVIKKYLDEDDLTDDEVLLVWYAEAAAF